MQVTIVRILNIGTFPQPLNGPNSVLQAYFNWYLTRRHLPHATGKSNMRKQTYTLYVFAYVLEILNVFPYPIMDSTPVGRTKGTPAHCCGDGRRQSPLWATEGRQISAKHICACLRILSISSYFLYVAPGATFSAESATPLYGHKAGLQLGFECYLTCRRFPHCPA